MYKDIVANMIVVVLYCSLPVVEKGLIFSDLQPTSQFSHQPLVLVISTRDQYRYSQIKYG
jgi:hypothetical protein